jgi:predicted metalloprotease with PDZ domain
LVALDGQRVDANRLPLRLAERAPGTTVLATVFRREELLEIPIVVGEAPAEAAAIVAVDGATIQQNALREAWLAPFQK